MQQADETFLTTTQEPRKLSIAISRYFSGELTEPDLKERYEKFLRQRSRAAMLIKDGSFQEMVKLAEGGFLTHALYQEAILKTADAGQTEMTVYLLRQRERLDPEEETKDPFALDF
mgnify:CR=1 FL=1